MTNEIKLLGYNNPYWINDPKQFLHLKQIIEKNPKLFGKILHGTGCYKTTYRPDRDKRQLLAWIDRSLPKLQSKKYTLGTKCYWILHGLVDFPVCPICGLKENYANMDINIFKGYPIGCTNRCRQKHQLTLHKREETCLDRFGVRYTWQSEEIKEKNRQLHQQNYGVDVPAKSPIIISRSESRCMELYGVKNGGGSKEALEKIQKTNLRKRGVKYVWQDPKVRAKSKAKMISKYGVKCYSKTTKFRQQYRKKSLEKYGVENPSQCPKIRRKQQQRYLYDDIGFDSAPEVALYIWLRDHQIQFEYQPNISFEYEFNGRKFRYFPDFKIGDQLIEIKGDHFFSEDGKMICPYRKKSWSDEEYQEECLKYETKHQCMLTNGIQIWTSKNYDFYLQYVKVTYGSNFFQSLKRYHKNDKL